MANLPSNPGSSQPITPAAREHVVGQLTESFAQDQLSLDEFERRVAEAYGAQTFAALALLTADLTTVPQPSALAPAGVMQSRIGGVMANVVRGGRLAVPARLDVRAIMGNVELDLRQAHFGSGVTEIAIRAVMGNIELRLPPNVHVDDQTSNVFSSVECRKPSRLVRDALATAQGNMPARVVRLTGRVVLSSVEATVAKELDEMSS